MEIWLDAQLSPQISKWICDNFKLNCVHVRELGLRDSTDSQIFQKAKERGEVIIISKDADFLSLLINKGAPPKIIWLTCGNTSNESLKKILSEKLSITLKLLNEGNTIVEITD